MGGSIQIYLFYFVGRQYYAQWVFCLYFSTDLKKKDVNHLRNFA